MTDKGKVLFENGSAEFMAADPAVSAEYIDGYLDTRAASQSEC